MIQNSDGQSVTKGGKNVLIGFALIATLIVFPVIINHLTHINILMEPRDYIETSKPITQADGTKLACTQYNAQTQGTQLAECRAVALFGMETAELFKTVIGVVMAILAVGVFFGVAWGWVKGFFS